LSKIFWPTRSAIINLFFVAIETRLMTFFHKINFELITYALSISFKKRNIANTFIILFDSIILTFDAIIGGILARRAIV